MTLHVTKNFMDLPKIKVPLILGVWGGKGQGKTFQTNLVFKKLGINPIVMSAGELESGNAGEPAKLVRQRYREASDIVKKGRMSTLFINDLDAGAGRMGGTTQYTVNNQMVNATLMNIADNPTNVQLPGQYEVVEIPRVPVIANGIFKADGVDEADVRSLVEAFDGQSIDFFGALRARVYDDKVREFIQEMGLENIGKRLVNVRKGEEVSFDAPAMSIEILLEYGKALENEQENVKRVQLADAYLDGAVLAGSDETSNTAMSLN